MKLPRAAEIETALLGSIFFEPGKILEVAEYVSPKDFYVPANEIIATAVWKLWGEGEPFDPGIIYEQLKKDNNLEKVGGHEGIMRLADCVPESSHATIYAKIIRKKAVLRKLILKLQENLTEAGSTQNSEVNKLLNKAVEDILQIIQEEETDESVTAAEVISQAIKQLEEESDAGGVSTGFYELDDMLVGPQNSQMIIIAGRPSMGKTTLALNIVEHVALKEKKAVAFFSLETSPLLIARNWLCSRAKVNTKNFNRKYCSKEDYEKLVVASKELSEAKVIFDKTMAATPFDLKVRARQFKAHYDVQLIIVDYLQLLEEKETESRQQEITKISRQLKLLATELDIPIIVLSQLSRKVEYRTDKKPILSDLRESGAIEQDADIVIMLYRQDYYRENHAEDDNIADVIIAKQKIGPTGALKLRFFRERLRFENLSSSEDTQDWKHETRSDLDF